MNIRQKKYFSENPEEVGILLLAVLFFAGFLFHQWDWSRKYVLKITDIFLFLSNSLIYIFLLRKSRTGRFVIWSLIAFALTFFLEYLGVKTGIIFGSYYYGSTMLFQFEGVPLVIAFNWLILILAVNSISRVLIRQKYLVPLLASVLIVVFDYIMEPVAVMLDYWQWQAGIIPAENYIAWFGISLFLGYLMMAMKLPAWDSRILRAYFFIQLLFFLGFRIFPVQI